MESSATSTDMHPPSWCATSANACVRDLVFSETIFEFSVFDDFADRFFVSRLSSMHQLHSLGSTSEERKQSRVDGFGVIFGSSNIITNPFLLVLKDVLLGNANNAQDALMFAFVHDLILHCAVGGAAGDDGVAQRLFRPNLFRLKRAQYGKLLGRFCSGDAAE